MTSVHNCKTVYSPKYINKQYIKAPPSIAINACMLFIPPFISYFIIGIVKIAKKKEPSLTLTSEIIFYLSFLINVLKSILLKIYK